MPPQILGDLHLISADLPFHCARNFTYMRDDGCVSSQPDHFPVTLLCSQTLTLFHHSSLAGSIYVNHSLTPPPPLPPSVSYPSSLTHIGWYATNPDLIASYYNLVSPTFLGSICNNYNTLHTELYSLLVYISQLLSSELQCLSSSQHNSAYASYLSSPLLSFSAAAWPQGHFIVCFSGVGLSMS